MFTTASYLVSPPEQMPDRLENDEGRHSRYWPRGVRLRLRARCCNLAACASGWSSLISRPACSSRSSKLFHGGLRRFEQLNFALVFEALRSARWPSTSWPHIWPSRCRFFRRRPVIDRAGGLGIGVYDVLGAGRGVPHHMRHLSRKRTFESFPPRVGDGDRLDPVLRRPGRRRQAHHDDRSHRGPLARRSPPARAWSAFCARRTESPASWFVILSPAASSPSERSRRSMPRSLDRRRVPGGGAGGRGQFRVRAHPKVSISWCRGTASTYDWADHPDREEPALHHPWGSHWIIGRPTPTGGSIRILPSRASWLTSTTC